MPRTVDELEIAARKQMSALQSSCAQFDIGCDWEAARIATSIFNLAYDNSKRRIHSILTQLDRKRSMDFYSTSVASPEENALPWAPLTYQSMTIGTGPDGARVSDATFMPLLDAPFAVPRAVSFDAWWAEPIYSWRNQHLSRQTLLATLRDQEGGSHFDAEVTDPMYLSLKSGAGMESSVSGVTEDGRAYETVTALAGGEAASARQIGFEMLMALRLAGFDPL